MISGAARCILLGSVTLATTLATTLAPAVATAQGTPGAMRADATPDTPWKASPPAARRGWTGLRIAKWALLGAATGFGVYALTHSKRADRDYGDLRALCTREPSGCTLDGGRYLAPRAEALYRGSVREDRRAQVGILGGQLTLLGSVALFVYDLRNARGPENIPYPTAGLRRTTGSRRVAAGASVRF